MEISTRIPIGTRVRALRRAAALSLVVAVALLLPAGSASASPDLEVSIMDDQLLLGASRQQIDGAMTVFRDLGIDRLRVSAFWNSIAPRERSRRKPSFEAANHLDPAYDWSQLDPVISSAAQHGIAVMVSITTPGPYWASASPRRRNGVWKPKPAEFAAFAFAVASRYGTHVDHFGILNEPNQGAWLQPQSDRRGLASPHLYRTLVQASHPAIKAAAPGSLVLVGELAPSGRDDRGATRPIRPLEFLRAMGCRDRRFNALRSGRCRGFQPVPADAIGHHPYSLFSPPRARSRAPDDAAIGDWRRLLRTLDRLVSRRAIKSADGARLDVYYTEFGYQTDPPDPFAGIPLSRHDRYLQDAAQLAWATPRVRGINQFRLTDGAIGSSRGSEDFREFQSGLLFRDTRPKPAFRSFPSPFAASTTRPRRGSRVRLWGQVRPGASHDVEIEYRRGSRGRFRRIALLRTNSRGYFAKRVRARSGVYRFRYSSPGFRGTSKTLRLRTR